MGGIRSKGFSKFKSLMVKGMLALREHAEKIISFVEMTMISGVELPCFVGGSERVLETLRDRFCLEMTEKECKGFMVDMIQNSTDNWRTRWYDKY
jgi:phosphatidylinositol 4-kinase